LDKRLGERAQDLRRRRKQPGGARICSVVQLSRDFRAIPAHLPGGRLLKWEGSPLAPAGSAVSPLWLNQYTGVLAILCSSIVPVPVCLSIFSVGDCSRD
jgi:hypothetical protein